MPVTGLKGVDAGTGVGLAGGVATGVAGVVSAGGGGAGVLVGAEVAAGVSVGAAVATGVGAEVAAGVGGPNRETSRDGVTGTDRPAPQAWESEPGELTHVVLAGFSQPSTPREVAPSTSVI